MATITDTVSLYQRLSGQLTHREAELRAQLQSAAGAAVHSSDDAAEVTDFKEVAAEEARLAVDDTALSHAAKELDEVLAALHRLDDGRYGLCIDCGTAIDERRLLVMPATRFCTACQAIHERPAALHSWKT
jgi:DnaK suppressor protein